MHSAHHGLSIVPRPVASGINSLRIGGMLEDLSINLRDGKIAVSVYGKEGVSEIILDSADELALYQWLWRRQVLNGTVAG